MTTTPPQAVNAIHKYPGVWVGIVTITPEFAADVLTRNTHNRNLKPRRVEAWVRDIAAENWDMNGETIKLAHDGTLLDGQNRLTAVVAAGKPIDSVVVTGLSPQAQDTVDTGNKRTSADTLTLNGYNHASQLAAAVVLLMKYELGRTLSPTTTEIETYIVEHPEVVEWTAVGVHYRKDIPELRATVMIAALTLFARIDAHEARVFFDDIAHSTTKGIGDPRSTLLKRIRSDRAKRAYAESWDQLIMIIRVWNAWRRGKPMSKIPYSADIVKPV